MNSSAFASQIRQITIPAIYTELRNQIAATLLPLAEQVEAAHPKGVFGMRVYNHMSEMADEAGKFAALERMTPREAGLLSLVCMSHDAGRLLAGLPQEKLIEYLDNLPSNVQIGSVAQTDLHQLLEELRTLKDKNLQHKHHALSAVFLIRENLLKSLPLSEQKVVIDACYHHGTARLELDAQDPANKFAVIVRDLDQSSIITNSKYVEAAGTLEQFQQWRISENEKNQLEELLKSPFFKASVENYLSTLFANPYSEARYTQSRTTLYSQALKFEALGLAVAHALTAWFEETPDAALLQRIGDWIRSPHISPPVFTKDEMIKNYSIYMIAHLTIALQPQSPSVRFEMANSAALKSRINFIKNRLPKYLFEEFIKPLADTLLAV